MDANRKVSDVLTCLVGLDGLGQLGNDHVQVAHNAQIRQLHHGAGLVLVDGDDELGVLHAGQVLTPAQARFMSNLLALMAEKNRLLTEKIRYLTQRSTRQKIVLYLSDLARKKGKATFSLPFNRQQMADFLSVDRSALSAELSKMKKEGLIDYRKDKFTLLQ